MGLTKLPRKEIPMNKNLDEIIVLAVFVVAYLLLAAYAVAFLAY